MTVYSVTVNSMATEQSVMAVLVDLEDLGRALELITGVRTLVAATVVALAPEVAIASAANHARWGPDFVEQLRQWARILPVVHVSGTPDDPRGEQDALRHATWLISTMDGEIVECTNGVAVKRKDAAAGEQPEAFIAFAPLPGQIN